MLPLPDIDVLKLTFRLRARDSVVLPPFLGSTLRGAFGVALKKVFCFVPHGICRTLEKNAAGKTEIKNRCWFYEACPYQYIFESPNFLPRETNHPKLRGLSEVPQPFVLQVPVPVSRKEGGAAKVDSTVIAGGRGTKNFNEDYRFNHFSRGETLEFSLVLLGRAVHFWPQALVAVRLAAENGLGEEKSRVSFALSQAFAYDADGFRREIFNSENPQLSAWQVAPVKLEKMIQPALETLRERFDKTPDAALEVEFTCPTSQRIFLREKPPAATLEFYDFLKKITERLEFLARLHADPPQMIDYRPILASAETVTATDGFLQFYLYQQDSNRKKRTIGREIFTGKMIYRGEYLSEYLAFLKAAEIVHVGSDTAHGMGNLVIR